MLYPKVAVIIATKNRCEELVQRSIASVIHQTIQANLVIVIDDSDEVYRECNERAVQALNQNTGFEIKYLTNTRTSGASGAWNEGIIYVKSQVKSPSDWFIAILDDDDSWESEYLQKCSQLIAEKNLDMVATDICRIEDLNGPLLTTFAPRNLVADDFLVCNPGIQGSNLFLRFNTLLAVGLFDENLRSTTDRDICIRISDLKSVNFRRLPEQLVRHYAEPGRARLTTQGSDAKLQGLTSFWRKYESRMTPSQKNDFQKRSHNLFGWTAPSSAQNERHKMIYIDAPRSIPFTLIVGVISGDEVKLKLLLDSFYKLHFPYLNAISILVLENGSDLSSLMKSQKLMGRDIILVPEDRQRRDNLTGIFGVQYKNRPHGQVNISYARTMLQAYIGEIMTAARGNARMYAWLLDDDMIIPSSAKAYLSWLPLFADDGVDVLIGSNEGASPNAPLLGMRVQILDLWHNLLWLKNLDDDSVLPDRSQENQVYREQFPDYYYDLSSRHSAHLEYPMWLTPAYSGESVFEAKKRLNNNILGILNGFPTTRGIYFFPADDPIKEAKESVNRGGNTFILNPRSLTDTPNIGVTMGEFTSRRSDMIWSIVNKHYRGMTIKAIPFPVIHSGRVPTKQGFEKTTNRNLKKVGEELLGGAFYGGLTKFLSQYTDHKLDFSDEDLEKIYMLIEGEIDRRYNLLTLNFSRIVGLRDILSKVDTPEVCLFVEHLSDIFGPKVLNEIEESIRSLTKKDFIRNLKSLRPLSENFAETRRTKPIKMESLWLT